MRQERRSRSNGVEYPIPAPCDSAVTDGRPGFGPVRATLPHRWATVATSSLSATGWIGHGWRFPILTPRHPIWLLIVSIQGERWTAGWFRQGRADWRGGRQMPRTRVRKAGAPRSGGHPWWFLEHRVVGG